MGTSKEGRLVDVSQCRIVKGGQDVRIDLVNVADCPDLGFGTLDFFRRSAVRQVELVRKKNVSLL